MVTRTLEFLSTFLWQAPPLEMQWEPRESFPDEAKKGTLISNCGVQNGALLSFAGTLGVPLEWRRVIRATS